MATSVQSPSQQHWSYFLEGVESAFKWPKAFILFYSSSTIQGAMLKTFLLNGVLFLGGLVVLETFYNSPEYRFFGCSYASLAGYPMYFALLGLNGTFYGKVAERAFLIQSKDQPSRNDSGNLSNAVQGMAATVYNCIFYINCGVFATLLRSIPHVGVLLSFISSCATMAYYCFEYRYLYLGWDLEQRMSYIEKHWSYFIGFGLPFTVSTFFLSTLRSSAVFALLYPCYVMMAFMATPKPTAPYGRSVASGGTARGDWMLPNKIPFFLPVRSMNKLVISVVRLVGGVHAEPIMPKKKETGANKEE